MEKPKDKPFPTEETVDTSGVDVRELNKISYYPEEGKEDHICELPGSTSVLARLNGDEITNVKVQDIPSYESCEVYNSGAWRKCKADKVARGTIYCFKVFGGDVVRLGPKHMQKVIRKGKDVIVSAEDIEVMDILNFDRIYMPVYEIDKTSLTGDLFSVDLIDIKSGKDKIAITLGNSFLVHDFSPDELNDT